MRIVHVTTHLRLGAGRAIVDLCRETRLRGHEVLLAVSEDAGGEWATDARLVDELAAADVPTLVIGDIFHRDLANLRRAAEVLGSSLQDGTPPAVAHAHTAIAAAVARWAGASPVVVTCHGWNLQRPAAYALQDALAFSMADAIVSPSTRWADVVRALPGISEVTVIPNGFDLSRYPPAPVSARAACGPRIVCVGELTAIKGQDVLVEAMPVIWRHHPGAELHLIGDGDMASALRQQAAGIGPGASRIHFHGHIARPYAELPNYDLFCLPSRSDNQPVAIVEAMLARLPVVATAVGGIPEMLARSGCGALVPAEDADALGEALALALRDPALAARGAAGETYAREEHDIARMVSRLEPLYSSARTGSSPPHHARRSMPLGA